MKDKDFRRLMIGVIIIFAAIIGLFIVIFHAFGSSWKESIIINAWFWGGLAAIGAVIELIRWQYEKDAKRCISCIVGCLVAAAAVYAFYYDSKADERQEAARQEIIQEIGSDFSNYFPEDKVQQFVYDYISSNQDWVKDTFYFYSEDDFEEWYDEAQAVVNDAYVKGWNDACNTFGIDSTITLEDIEVPDSPEAYITPTGTHYHLSQSCAGENAIETTIADAFDEGYTPCQKCAA